MQLKIKSLVVLFLLTILSCKNANKQSFESASTDAVESAGVMSEPPVQDGNSIPVTADTASSPIDAPNQVLNAGSPAPITDWDKKIIKTADVSVEVKDFGQYDKHIHSLTKKYGAYIAGEQQSKNDIRMENIVTIKVPVEQFEALVNSFPGEDAKVLQKRITTEDVTDQLVDTKARIEAKKQVRDRYLELLKQAKSMKDILEVQREINSIQEELEAASGRVQYLSHQSAYSTINLTYFEYLDGSSGSEHSFITKIKAAFKEGSSIITGFLLMIISFWPLVVVALVIWWVVRKPTFKIFGGKKKS